MMVSGSGHLAPVAEGLVVVEPVGGQWQGWLRISIGRRKRTRRISISPQEAAQLTDLLVALRDKS